MAIERTYIIPLRKEYQKVPTYKKSKKAVKAVKEFVARHLKAEMANVKIMRELNLEIWKHGIRNPPHKVKVKCMKDDKGVVLVQLFGKPFPEPPKAPEKKGLAAKVAEKIAGKKEETKKEVAPSKPEASHAGNEHAGERNKELPTPASKSSASKTEAPKPSAQKPAPANRQTSKQGN